MTVLSVSVTGYISLNRSNCGREIFSQCGCILFHELVSAPLSFEVQANPHLHEGRKEGEREGICSTTPSSFCSTTDREVFDAVMKSDGCDAQGGSW